MKTTHPHANRILLTLILGLGLALIGCKKETPPPQKTVAPTATAPDETVKEEEKDQEKDFLSDPDVVTCELKQTKISELNLPKNNMASFIRRMERDKREDTKEGLIIFHLVDNYTDGALINTVQQDGVVHARTEKGDSLSRYL